MLKIFIYWHKCWRDGTGQQAKIELLSFWSVNRWVSQFACHACHACHVGHMGPKNPKVLCMSRMSRDMCDTHFFYSTDTQFACHACHTCHVGHMGPMNPKFVCHACHVCHVTCVTCVTYNFLILNTHVTHVTHVTWVTWVKLLVHKSHVTHVTHVTGISCWNFKKKTTKNHVTGTRNTRMSHLAVFCPIMSHICHQLSLIKGITWPRFRFKPPKTAGP